jgi:hypothetical protein
LITPCTPQNKKGYDFRHLRSPVDHLTKIDKSSGPLKFPEFYPQHLSEDTEYYSRRPFNINVLPKNLEIQTEIVSEAYEYEDRISEEP